MTDTSTPPKPTTPPKQALLEERLPTAEAMAVRYRASGMSWQAIADELEAAADMNLSRESVRRWYEPAFKAEQARRWEGGAR